MKRATNRVILLVLSLAMVLALAPLSAVLADGTVVSINPPSQSANVGDTVTVEVKVDSVSNLYGVDVRLTFDAAKLRAQDADGNSANGVQIASGTFLNPAQGFLAQNTVNNTTGAVQYVFALMAPATPVSGSGVLARITFTAIAAGNAAVTLTSVTLSNDQAQPITATLANGAVTVVGAGPTPTPTVGPTATPGPTPTSTPPGCSSTYVVKFGDTLYSISRRFGMTVTSLAQFNNLANPNLIWIGQVLRIPCGGPVPTPGPGQTYVVQAGDNLFRIALKFGTTVQALVAANNIVNPNFIRVGAVLVIPGGTQPPPPSQKTYVVKAGDTLSAIAASFGVSVFSIVALNNLANPNLIFPGQVLQIP